MKINNKKIVFFDKIIFFKDIYFKEVIRDV